MTSTQSEVRPLSEVRALLDSREEACRAKDIDRLMSLYSPDSIYFDVVPPLHFAGSAAIRHNFLRWFDEYEGLIDLETRNLNIQVSGDVAFAHMLHLDSGNRNGDYCQLSGPRAGWRSWTSHPDLTHSVPTGGNSRVAGVAAKPACCDITGRCCLSSINKSRYRRGAARASSYRRHRTPAEPRADG